MNANNNDEQQEPATPFMADLLPVDQPIELTPLHGQTSEQNDSQQNNTDFACGFESVSACQTNFGGVDSDTKPHAASGSYVDSFPPNPDGDSVDISDCTTQSLEDWQTNGELQRLQMSAQETAGHTLQDITVSDQAANESHHSGNGHQAAVDDAVETKDVFQFDDLQLDGQQVPSQENTNPNDPPILNVSAGLFQIPGFQNAFELGWEGMEFVHTEFSMLHATETRTSYPMSLSGWNPIVHGTLQWNSPNQMCEADSVQSCAIPNVAGIDPSGRVASWDSEYAVDGDSRDDASAKTPQVGSSSTQSVDLTKLPLDIEKDEFVLNPDGTPRVSTITATSYKKVDFLPDSIDYRRLNGAVLIRAELKGASLKAHIIPRIDPNTLRAKQKKSLKEEIQSRKEEVLKEEQKLSIDGESDSEKNISQGLQGVEDMQTEVDNSSVASEGDGKSNEELEDETATNSKASMKNRVRSNLQTVAERLSRCLSNMKQKYRKDHNLGFAYGANVLKQRKGSATKEPTKEASRVLEGGSIGIEKLLFNTVGEIDHTKSKFKVPSRDRKGFEEYPLEKPQDIPGDLHSALQKLKPESWKSFAFKDEYIAEHPQYADYEPESHVDWQPWYRSMARVTSEDKGQEGSEQNWLDFEENNVDELVAPTRYPCEIQGHAQTTSLPEHLHATQARRELKRSRSEAELDDELHQTAAGGIGHQSKKKHVD